MVRYEKEEGHIKIAWGYDRALCGYFFSVVDNRLKQPSEASEDVKRICRTVSEDGGGSYFDLNTYFAGGFGHQVSETTIFAFMRRYGIDPTRINVDDSKPTMDLPTGGETPELRLDPAYIKRRRARIQDAIERCLDDPCPICVPRIDRTITELSKDNSVPIVRVGLVPPPWLARTIFFFPHDAYPNGYKVCSHPDCCIPERDEKHRKCSKCKQAVYCSRTCQVAHWKDHKTSCQPNEP